MAHAHAQVCKRGTAGVCMDTGVPVSFLLAHPCSITHARTHKGMNMCKWGCTQTYIRTQPPRLSLTCRRGSLSNHFFCLTDLLLGAIIWQHYIKYSFFPVSTSSSSKPLCQALTEKLDIFRQQPLFYSPNWNARLKLICFSFTF